MPFVDDSTMQRILNMRLLGFVAPHASIVWAFGVTAWEILTCGTIPHDTISDDDRVMAFVRGGGQLERPVDCRDASYDELWVSVYKGPFVRPAHPPYSVGGRYQCREGIAIGH